MRALGVALSLMVPACGVFCASGAVAEPPLVVTGSGPNAPCHSETPESDSSGDRHGCCPGGDTTCCSAETAALTSSTGVAAAGLPEAASHSSDLAVVSTSAAMLLGTVASFERRPPRYEALGRRAVQTVVLRL